jgi:hypothetical protein
MGRIGALLLSNGSMLINPRLTDYHGVSASQADLDFAIPFFKEDIPLYVDPFLLWKSPSQQDAVDADSAIDERHKSGRQSRVVLTPRRRRQVSGGNSADDGDKKARSPGRARYKP